MESNINHHLINQYSKSYSAQLIDRFFSKKIGISGKDILNLSETKQINYFVLKILFEKWKSEFDSLKSPYFDYEKDEVQNAAISFMNVLSKNIMISKEDFKPLLEEATYKTILLIFSPYEYYLQEINKPAFQQISINDLYSIQKYIKINGHLLNAYIDRFNTEGIQAVFNDDAVRIFDEVCETTKDTPEDFDLYHQELSKVVALDLNKIYSHPEDSSEDLPKDDPEHETGSINEKFNSKKKTLLDTLGSEKKEVILDIHANKSLEGIRKIITINQRFMFENDLFNGNKDEFEMVINYLDNCSNLKEAMDFINENFKQKKNWDMEKAEVIEFFDVINKRFPK